MANVIWNPGINAYNPTVELIVTQKSQSIDGNYSVLEWSLILHRPSNVSSSASKSYNVKINNVTVASGTTTLGGSGDKTIASGTSTVYHNADGTKTEVPFSFYMDIGITWSGSSTGNASGSGIMNLTTIPRATTPTLSDGNIEMGSAVTINTPRASGSFTHILKYTFGNASGTIAIGVGTSYAWTIPLSLANQIPNAASGVGTITCETYNGTTLIGTKTVQFTATVPDSMVPSVSISTSGVDLYQSQYVQGKSKVKVTLNESGSYGSTIKSRTTTIKSGNNTISASTTSPFTSGVLNFSGTITIITTITDSRGRTASATKTISVVAYSSARVVSFSAYRANADGSPNPQGAYIKMTGTSLISTINNTNLKTTILRYREKGSTTWTNVTTNTTLYNPTLTTIVAADENKSFEAQIYLSDYFGNAQSLVNIGTAFVLMDLHYSGTGMAIGKVAEYENAFEVYLRSNILKFSSIHSHDWNTASSMQGKSYLGGWHGPLAAEFTKGYMSIGATTSEQSIDFMIDGDMFVQEGVNKVWNNTNCQVLSNANGVAYKFENGLMITVQRHNVYTGIANQWGALYASGQILVPDYPAAFIEVPTTTITAYGQGGTVITGKNHSPAPTIYNAGGVEAFRGTSFSALNILFSIIAIGRWK